MRSAHADGSAGVCEVQAAHVHLCSSVLSAEKKCRRCGQSKPLELFPRDRSRLDGRWHTCKECNQQWCRFQRWAVREHKKRELAASPPPQPAPGRRLEGLKSYRNTNGDRFSQLPPRERFIAQQLLNKYLHKHRGPRLSQPKMALLMACAASNVKRVGDKSWSRRMKRLKGWRRQLLGELRVQLEPPQDRPRIAQQGYSDAVWTQTSRLRGI
jgi:hypothetical protein